MKTHPFKTDLEQIRRRAREKMRDGAVTDAYKADREQVISKVEEEHADELVSMLRRLKN